MISNCPDGDSCVIFNCMSVCMIDDHDKQGCSEISIFWLFLIFVKLYIGM